MKADLAVAKQRSDYLPPEYTIDTVDLDIRLDPHNTEVTSVMQVRRLTDKAVPLQLDGEKLTLIGVAVDGEPLDSSRYQETDNQLIINDLPEQFELTIENLIAPADNAALEGLYMSDGAYCTQCEAEGFRRITYYLDRPDVLAKFTTRVEAPILNFPYLLANGNPIEQGVNEDRHYVVWQDPFPKPCYLFALVAGDFDELTDSFVTMSGKTVDLRLYVDKGKAARGYYALDSLKRAMAWDEQTFGLEYDLDIYMIVAVDFFNMGAMENKGLNIFNSKYVLADDETATDRDYLGIESVIAHEYFHNWTGDRVTCRDWFQLSLKEGLTVFRDQSFSQDMQSATVKRIEDVRIIRNHQFAEDAGPMSHPIRPEKVIEMNNFYTVTVYDKGAEVIRMMNTLLGRDGFRKGMDLYFQRHDGQAVTCDDFVAAMEDANDVSLALFRRWYSQSGTPELTVSDEYDAAAQQYRLTVKQHTPATADQVDKQPLHIPFAINLLRDDGSSYPLTENNEPLLVLNVTEEEHTFVFDQIDQAPIPALLCNFSAPVKLFYDYTDEQLMLLASHAVDGFVRWDACQVLFTRYLFAYADAQGQGVEMPENVLATFRSILTSDELEPALIAELLTPPGFASLLEQRQQIDVDALLAAQQWLDETLAVALAPEARKAYDALAQEQYHFDGEAAGKRRLRNHCLYLLACADHDRGNKLVTEHYQQADNMTDRIAALSVANRVDLPCRQALLDDYDKRWGTDGLIMDKWLSLQGSWSNDQCLANLEKVCEHPVFSWHNPNRIRSVYASFAQANPRQFHRADGKGYATLADVVIRLNSYNPQIAARLVSPLTRWKRFDASRQKLIQQQLQRIYELPELARDLQEIVGKALPQD